MESLFTFSENFKTFPALILASDSASASIDKDLDCDPDVSCSGIDRVIFDDAATVECSDQL